MINKNLTAYKKIFFTNPVGFPLIRVWRCARALLNCMHLCVRVDRVDCVDCVANLLRGAYEHYVCRGEHTHIMGLGGEGTRPPLCSPRKNSTYAMLPSAIMFPQKE